MTKPEYQAYEAQVARYLTGLTFVSTGACSQCPDCGGEPCPDCGGTGESDGQLANRCSSCDDRGFRLWTDAERDCADEPHFSWHPCEICGSPKGGDRHPWHARNSKYQLVHGTCCSGCMYYLNYGKLDDQAMLDMEGLTDSERKEILKNL